MLLWLLWSTNSRSRAVMCPAVCGPGTAGHPRGVLLPLGGAPRAVVNTPIPVRSSAPLPLPCLLVKLFEYSDPFPP